MRECPFLENGIRCGRIRQNIGDCDKAINREVCLKIGDLGGDYVGDIIPDNGLPLINVAMCRLGSMENDLYRDLNWFDIGSGDPRNN